MKDENNKAKDKQIKKPEKADDLKLKEILSRNEVKKKVLTRLSEDLESN